MVKEWAVIDEEAYGFPVLGRFSTEQEASEWIGQQLDQDKVYRGGFGLEGPADD